MNVINIKIKPLYFDNPTVTVDGNVVKLTKCGPNEYSGTYETERSEANLRVCMIHELQSKYWLLLSMVFFVISLFGIFDARYDKSFCAIKYNLDLRLNEVSNVVLNFNKFKDGQRAIECLTDCGSVETENLFYVDEQVKKRHKILRRIKIFTWLAVLAAAIVAIVLTIIL
ncbi:MAG: hypothetical protein HDP34_06195 [Clostridia bacterium]|nr:hypothetical protein [Clostridia bacterium]